MNQKRPQYFTSSGLSRHKQGSRAPKSNGMQSLRKTFKKKSKKPVLSDEAAKAIAMVLKEMLKKPA